MNTKLRIIFSEENFETTATMLENEAPKTCEAVSKILPFEGPLLHAMVSGNEVLVELHGDKLLRIEPENWVYSFPPGDVGFWYSHWGEGAYLKGIKAPIAEIVFIYGRHVRLRNLAHINPPNRKIEETVARHNNNTLCRN